MSIPSPTGEHSRYIEIDTGHEVYAVTFTANGKYLVGGSDEGVGVWRVRDSEQVAKMKMKDSARCIAVSKDDRWIAAGSSEGEVFVWDARTHERVFADKMGVSDDAINVIYAVDFSPDSTQLVAASSNGTATVFDIAAGQRVKTFCHATTWALMAKYSPRGDQITTASSDSIRVWNSKDDTRSLVNVRIPVNPWYGLVWFDDHLFVVANDSKIKRIDASTGSIISEWSVPHTDYTACIALPQHGEYVAYSAGSAIRFWSTSTHTQHHLVTPYNDICSIAFSPDDQRFAIGAGQRKIVVTKLSFVKEPEIRDSAALDSWKHGQLTNAEALLTAEIQSTKSKTHYILASRALVRARLQHSDAAIVDAEESIRVQPSVMGYIAKCVALVSKGERDGGLRVCDIAFEHFPSDYVTLLLLIKAVVLFMDGEYNNAIARIDDLIVTVFFNSALHVVQAYMYLILGSLQMGKGDFERAIQSFERARVRLGDRTDRPPLLVSLISGWKFDELAVTIQQNFCEALFVVGRTKEAGEFVSRLKDQEVNMPESMKTWASDFMQRCLETPQNPDNTSGDTSEVQVPLETSRVPNPTPLSREWARSRLMTGSWKDALTAAVSFTFPRFVIYQVLCEHLEMTDRLADAIACFHQMHNELAKDVDQASWVLDFLSRCCKKLEVLGDTAMNAGQYEEAISQYTDALSLNPAARRDLLVKRSKARAGKGMWEDALDDANEIVKLDPSSPLGYERKNTALYGMGYGGTADAFETMLLKMSQSSDPDIREQSRRYIRPEEMKATIRTTIEDTICDSPTVLINTTSGRLCHKSEQAAAFESTLPYMELVSTMTMEIDYGRIEQEVGNYFRYATFSHKWEANEPIFEKVSQIVVYDLEQSPTHDKLKMFCKIVREAGFNWAWSDTCCINKQDHFVLQEALVDMFRWYEGSEMTIIFLRGVGRLAQRGALTRSIWNSRLWTLEEYHASKVVRFYTEDWTPYLGLDIFNHKASPEIVSEMEEATGISSQTLMALRPGLDDIRKKLCLASKRKTTLVEDTAYALLGIFSISLPIVYGVGDEALSRLLVQLLTSSGDTSILAWTGRSGSFNSCLPANITVFSQPPTSHIPPALADAEMVQITAGLRSLNHTLVTMLYDQLNGLPVPSFSGQRMKLPCLTFKLGQVSTSRTGPEHVCRAQTNALGIVEIRTTEDLSRLNSLYLIHPWIDFLLDRQPLGSVWDSIFEDNVNVEPSVLGELPSFSSPSNMASTRTTRRARLMRRFGRLFGGQPTTAPDTVSLLPPSTLSPVEKRTRVLQLIARLRQPFGALLLTSTRRNVDEYRRVCAESLITVQVREITPATLEKLVHGVRVLDVL